MCHLSFEVNIKQASLSEYNDDFYNFIFAILKIIKNLNLLGI